MSRLRLAAAPAVLSVALLTACGGGGDSESGSGSEESGSTAPAVAAATGDVVEGEGFSFNAPEGWEQQGADSVPGYNFAALALDPKDDDGFADNINVIEDPAIADYPDLDERLEAAKKGLETINTSGLTDGDPVTMDGEEAAVLSATLEQSGSSSAMTQYYVVHDDTGYVITFSYSADRPEAERQEIAQSVAAAWSWS